ncbi:MAG: hypothetical protein R6V76_05185 [Desulfobacterales bacterium]
MKSVLKIKHIITVVICIFFLNGCVSGMAGWKGHNVKEENRIHLEKTPGKSGGVWKTGDLSLKYDYLIKGDRIQINGKTTLTDKLTYFTTLDHLSIMVQFLDNEGMVLDHETVYISSSRVWIPMAMLSFSRSFVLPSETVSMSFSYSGKVSDGIGDEGIEWDFWNTP